MSSLESDSEQAPVRPSPAGDISESDLSNPYRDRNEDFSGAVSRESKTRYGVLSFTVVMAVLLYLDRYAISVATPAMMSELGLDESQMGYAISAFFWAYALGQVPAGRLADRWGGRRALTLYVTAWSLALIGLGLAGSLAALIAMRLLLGLGQAGAYATAASFLKKWLPIDSRGFANGAVSMGGRGGGLLAALITPQLMLLAGVVLQQRTDLWRSVFLLYAGLGFVWAYFFWRWFRDTPREHSQCNEFELRRIEAGSAAAPAAPISATKMHWGQLLTSKNIWLLSLINFAVNVGWIFLVTWLPTFLKNVHQTSLVAAGTLTSLTGLAGMAGCLCGGVATDRMRRRLGSVWGRRLPGLLATAGAATAYLFSLGVDRPTLLIALFAAAYFFADLALATTWATYQDIGGSHVATVLGFANMCGNFGAAIFAGAIGGLAKQGQWQTVFIVSAASFTIATVCWFFVDPRVPLSPAADAI